MSAIKGLTLGDSDLTSFSVSIAFLSCSSRIKHALKFSSSSFTWAIHVSAYWTSKIFLNDIKNMTIILQNFQNISNLVSHILLFQCHCGISSHLQTGLQFFNGFPMLCNQLIDFIRVHYAQTKQRKDTDRDACWRKRREFYFLSLFILLTIFL